MEITYGKHCFNLDCSKEDECELPICLGKSCNEHSNQRYVKSSLSKVLPTECQYNENGK
jgi:hypothetical protein